MIASSDSGDTSVIVGEFIESDGEASLDLVVLVKRLTEVNAGLVFTHAAIYDNWVVLGIVRLLQVSNVDLTSEVSVNSLEGFLD